jgi:hypothetical protein
MSYFSGFTSYFSSDPAAKLTAAKAKVTDAEAALQAAKDEVTKLEGESIPATAPVSSDGVTGGRRRKGKKSKRTRRTATRSRSGRKSSRL